MKKIILSTALLLMGTAAFMRAGAQITVPASNADLFVTNFNDYGYPNSYTLDYSPYCTASMPCSGTKKQLTALVSDDGATARLYVNDQTPPVGAVWPSVVLPSGGGSAPDVILGNDSLNPGQYIAGVVAVTGGNVVVYLYQISNVGNGGGTLTITGPYATFNVTTSGTAVAPAHIDAACLYSTKYPNPASGLPLADQYSVVWQDVTTGIMGYADRLNNTSGIPVAAPTIIDGNLNVSSPDVAYVERGASTVLVAEIAYVDMTIAGGPNTLFYNEWQPVTTAIAGPTVYDVRSYFNPQPGVASVLRIDGIDDYTKNAPGGANAWFCIAASAPPPGVSVLVYTPLPGTGPFAPYNITAPVVAPGPGIKNARNQIPVVTSGPGKFYSVGFWSDPPSSSGGAQQMYFATAVNWNTGKPTTNPNAYAIMQQSYDPSFLPGLCLSATGNTNTIGTQDLFAGYENYAFLLYKYSLPVAPYAFKQAPATPAIAAATGEWQVYPNPATDQVSLMAPAGFNTTGVTYDITDMSGKTMQSSTIDAAAQQIKTKNLPVGTYLLNVHTDASNTQTIKFVKE